MAAQGPPKVGPVHATLRDPEGGWSLRRLQKPNQDSTWHSSAPQRAKGRGGGFSLASPDVVCRLVVTFSSREAIRAILGPSSAVRGLVGQS